MRVTLGFDTSCYTTSAAAVNEQGEVVAASRLLLPVKQGERGLRQSEAVFAHVRQMPQIMQELQQQLAALDVKRRQAESIKARLERQMDSLSVTDPHYDQKIDDLQRRYDEQYDVLAGRWPEAKDEAVIVLQDPNTIPDHSRPTRRYAL